jgi:integrase
MASIRKTKDKKGRVRWVAQIYLGRDSTTGKPRFVSKTFDREKEAETWAKRLEAQRDDGLYRPSLTRVSFAKYLEDMWLPLYKTQVRSTYTIEKVLGKWIFRSQPDVPFLGCLALRKLAVADFDRLYAAMAEKGMQRRGIEHLHGILKRALKSAVRKGELPRNPAEFATLPKPEAAAVIRSEQDEADVGPVEYLTREQAVRFLDEAKKDRLSALWHLLLDAGLRPGEAFALQWRHLDVEKGVVKVRGTMSRLHGERENGAEAWIVTKPKTASSRGDVPLSTTTLSELRKWKAQQARERLQLGEVWKDYGFIFTTEFGTPLGNNVGRAWARLLRQADGGRGDLGTWGAEPKKPRSGPTASRPFKPRFSVYVLRHTCATLALLDGVDLLQVSRRLRHKNISITARFYGHLKAEHTKQAAESFDRLAAPRP